MKTNSCINTLGVSSVTGAALVLFAACYSTPTWSAAAPIEVLSNSPSAYSVLAYYRGGYRRGVIPPRYLYNGGYRKSYGHRCVKSCYRNRFGKIQCVRRCN
jgi:hypothetical protein